MIEASLDVATFLQRDGAHDVGRRRADDSPHACPWGAYERRAMNRNPAGAAYELRAFWLYWASTTISYLGDGMRFVALPLLAITLTSSPAQVASVTVAAGLPWPIFGLVAGIAVDRLDRNRLLVSAQAMRASLGFFIAFGVAAGRVSLIILIA